MTDEIVMPEDLSEGTVITSDDGGTAIVRDADSEFSMNPGGNTPPADTPNDAVADVDDIVDDTKPNYDSASDDLVDDKNKVVDDEDSAALEAETKEVYSGIGKILSDSKILSTNELNLESPEDLKAAIENEIKARFSEEENRLRESLNKGVDVSELNKFNTALTATQKLTKESFDSNVNLAKQMVTAGFKLDGISEDNISRYVEMFEDAGTLADEALKAKAKRETYLAGKVSEVEQAAVDAQKAAADKRVSELESLDKALDAPEFFNRKVAKSTTQKLKDLVYTSVNPESDQPVNAIMKYHQDNPEEYEAKVAYLFLVTNGFKDLSSFDRSAEKRHTQSFKGSVRKLSGSSKEELQVPQQRVTVVNTDGIQDIVT